MVGLGAIRYQNRVALFHHQLFLGLPRRCPTLPFIIPRMTTKRFMQAVEILAPEDQFIPGVAQSVKANPLPMHDSLQIKAAEYWLKFGDRGFGIIVGRSKPGLLHWGC